MATAEIDLINSILDKIRDASDNDSDLKLSSIEVKSLAEHVGDIYVIPHYTADEILQLHKEGKLGQKN
ncbi:hypothetical protein [Acinetobacter rudis]|uniref:hypothetical protein n=1 Tax=Acinetobacter rudis TaxID=632955 RepID=UPI0033414939